MFTVPPTGGSDHPELIVYRQRMNAFSLVWFLAQRHLIALWRNWHFLIFTCGHRWLLLPWIWRSLSRCSQSLPALLHRTSGSQAVWQSQRQREDFTGLQAHRQFGSRRTRRPLQRFRPVLLPPRPPRSATPRSRGISISIHLSITISASVSAPVSISILI